jgi:hypothetical protein
MQYQLWNDAQVSAEQSRDTAAQIQRVYVIYVEALRVNYVAWLGTRDSSQTDHEVFDYHLAHVVWPDPEARPTLAHVLIASRLLWEFGKDAFRLSRVHEVWEFLCAMAENPTLEPDHNAAAYGLVEALAQRMLPHSNIGPFTPAGVYALDATILADYEQAHATIKRLYAQHTTTLDRARALHERYPAITEAIFHATIEGFDSVTNVASRMASFVVSQQYHTTPTVISQRVLPRARRARTRRRS